MIPSLPPHGAFSSLTSVGVPFCCSLRAPFFQLKLLTTFSICAAFLRLFDYMVDLGTCVELGIAGFQSDAIWLGVAASAAFSYVFALKARIIQERRKREKGNLNTTTQGGVDWCV